MEYFTRLARQGLLSGGVAHRLVDMKITGPGQIQSSNIKKTSKKGGSDGGVFARTVAQNDEAEGSKSVGGAAPLTSVDALLSLQEVPDATDGRSKGLARANEMLDLLEEVRKGILLGAISGPKLRVLADLARNQRLTNGDSSGTDPRLREVLSEIELRSEVELAKLGY